MSYAGISIIRSKYTFNTIFLNSNCVEFHEFSALVSDGGSLNQPIHPDSPYQDECPLYTGTINPVRRELTFFVSKSCDPDFKQAVKRHRVGTLVGC